METHSCFYCGAKVVRIPAQVLKHVYCSKVCMGLGKRSPLPPSLVAEYCAGASLMELGAKYHAAPKSLKKHLIGQGIAIRSKGAHMETDKNPTRGKGHTEETKAKLRAANAKQFADPAARQQAAERTIKQIQDGRTGKAYNRLETRVAERLRSEGVNFVQQYRVGFYVFDFYLPDTNTLLEANGGFWHADPRFYPADRITSRQKATVVRDTQKRTYAQNKGYCVEVAWEYDVTGRNPWK